MFYHHWLIELKEKSKRGFCDTSNFGNNRENLEFVEPMGHALILLQKGIRNELHLIFVK